MYNEFEIRQIPLSLKNNYAKVTLFLKENGLRIDHLDYYAGVFANDGDELLGGGGLAGNVIKCLAVSEKLRDEGFSTKLVSHLVEKAMACGYLSVRLFTKPENQKIFESLGFRLLAKAEKALLLEIGSGGMSDYCHYLSTLKRQGKKGVIVMNANPLTRGHEYLVETATKKVDWLYLIPVKEDASLFSYKERKDIIKKSCEKYDNVIVCDGSDYAVSKLTFPTYFLKQITDATDTHIALDLDLFSTQIARALDVSIRFVGSEPNDGLTRKYNEVMKEILPMHGIEVKEIERLSTAELPISASLVRKNLLNGVFSFSSSLAAKDAIPYIIAHLATNALQQELDLTPKPGLVDRSDAGAHYDMDAKLMQTSIDVLHSYFVEVALATFQSSQPDYSTLSSIGLKAEEAMFVATNGVNTHKGAFFALGLAVAAASHLYYNKGEIEESALQECIKSLALLFPETKATNGRKACDEYGIKGALANAQEGYATLFADWLPFYHQLQDDEYKQYKLLLCIMSSLDDSNVCHRRGKERLDQMKQEAKETLDDFSVEALQLLNQLYIAENVSPGGGADMLSLTLFINAILN